MTKKRPQFLPDVDPTQPMVETDMNYNPHGMELGFRHARLEWDGHKLKATLAEDGSVLFDVTPQEITKVHDYEREAIKFFIGGKKYFFFYPMMVVGRVASSVAGTTIGGASGISGGPAIGAGQNMAEMRSATMNSSVNSWLALLIALGVKTRDFTIVPPPATTVIGWTFSVTIGFILALTWVGFTCNILFGGF